MASPPGLNNDDLNRQDLTLTTHRSINDIDPLRWDQLATSTAPYNPFVSHRFLKILEDSGSIASETGWMPTHLSLEKNGEIMALAPAYLKGHSQGEYVFDHHWADAYHRAGGKYYPKLVIASPFTPVSGPRLLCADQTILPIFGNAIAQLTQQLGLSTAHVNFTTQTEQAALSDIGFLPRLGEQFHWYNRAYQSFDDFLNALSSRKRKTIRQERRKAIQNGIDIQSITGDQIKAHHWDAFWRFYQDTGARKWGTPYLTREAFSMLAEQMSNDLLMTIATPEDEKDPIAGALHMIGGDTLYGRYWGCTEQAKFLHFECCYYQAIDYAINNDLSRVEAGAQGHHKLARGYEPVLTYSAHYIPDPGFRDAIAHYLEQERLETNREIDHLKDYTPFKKINSES